VASLSKKYVLKRLIEINRSDINFLQETMGVGIEVTTLLEKLLKNWNFSSMDDRGCSGSLAMG
jgi:hypothetical protein